MSPSTLLSTHPFTSRNPSPKACLKRQTGAALLLLLGIGVLALSGIFLAYPEYASPYRLERDRKTTQALFAAKQALLGWAASHPHAPGLLPWTDRNGDGNYDGDSDCASLGPNAAFNPSFLLGRLPWRGRTNPCEVVHGGLGIDVRDSMGQHLWYAVSRNTIRRYQSPARYPRIDPALANTAPFPWLTVRDANNTVISDRVAAVILAAGPALNGQDRSANAPGARNYLDVHAPTGIDNADADGCFDQHPGCGGNHGEDFVLAEASAGFNDKLVFVTVDEWMGAIEERVLNEVDRVLDGYRKNTGVYPWMSPFAYPTNEVSGLAGGSGNSGSSGNTLDDPARSIDFHTLGIRAGDMVENLRDGTRGAVVALSSPHSITVNRLGTGATGEETMEFDPGDGYTIPRFNGMPGTWEGALPFHVMGEGFRTGFRVGWHIPGETPNKISLADNPGYLTSLERSLRCSDDAIHGMAAGLCNPDRFPGNVPKNVPWANGSCAWEGIETVRCQGKTDWAWYLAGTVAGTSGPLEFQDGGTDFQGLGVERGDVVLNLADGAQGVIAAVDHGAIRAVGLYGGARNRFETGDEYRIRAATRLIPEKHARCADVWDGTDTIACGPGALVDTEVDFWESGARPGDTIENRTQGWWAIIETVGRAGPFAHTENILRVRTLPDMPGAQNGFADGDAYAVRAGFVDQRRYGFHLAFSGEATVAGRGGVRDVRTGSGVPLPPGNEVRIEDRDARNLRAIMDAAITASSTTVGEIAVSGIQLDLHAGFPPWFLAGNWHHVLYAAAAPSRLPGGNGACIPGQDCLTLRMENMAGSRIRDNVAALVIAAGRETDGTGCPQIRPARNPAQYVEGENIHPLGNEEDFTFEGRRPRFMDECFRDRARAVE